jgi:hypothetical protein
MDDDDSTYLTFSLYLELVFVIIVVINNYSIETIIKKIEYFIGEVKWQ